MLWVLLAFTFLISFGHANYLPENNIRIPVDSINSGMNEKQFHAAIDKVEKIYSPLVKEHGAKLRINREWKNERVNATTTRTVDSKVWIINLFGGLARHPEITPDAFTLVICHELGHHLGGAPKKKRGDPLTSYWASTEGEADYYATLKCLRRVFANEDNELLLENVNIPDFVQTSCQKSFQTEHEKAICIRSTLAGGAVSRMGAAVKFRKMPQFEITDSRVVTTTYPEHPASQCRLDTYINGALCRADYRENISDINYLVGACYTGKIHTSGARPFCWFRPQAGKPHE